MANQPIEYAGTSNPPAQSCFRFLPAVASHTSLDPTETKPQSPKADSVGIDIPQPSPSIAFRHSGWQATRKKVYAALVAAGMNETRLDAFEHCGSSAWVLHNPNADPNYMVKADHCHDRWCQICAQARSRVIANNTFAALKNHSCRLLTLTLRSASEPLADLLNSLYDGFRMLRRRQWWKDGVRGCLAFLEIKLGIDGERWHPHLHIILSGRYIPQADISAAWHEITQDSHIVDIRAVSDHRKAVEYVAKYASKPLCPTLARNHDKLVEAIVSLNGRRLCLTTGCFRSIRLSANPNGNTLEADGWLPVMTLSSLINAADAGDSRSQQILHSLRSHSLCQTDPDPPPITIRRAPLWSVSAQATPEYAPAVETH